MAREHTVEGFILKKQDIGEADQIVTIFSKQEGKLRCLAKAAKKPTSKLQPALQPLFRTQLTLAGATTLPKIIRAQTVQSYSGIYADADKLRVWFVVAEFLIKSVGDGAPHDQLYAEIADYTAYMNIHQLSSVEIDASLLQFQIKALTSLGLGVHLPIVSSSNAVWFSVHQGGFITEGKTSDAIPITFAEYRLFERIAKDAYGVSTDNPQEWQRLTQLTHAFITYQLERELKSHRFGSIYS